MRIKSHRLLCFLLVITVSLSGMCFINDRTDSLPACAPVQTIYAHILPMQTSLSDESMCTIEMLEVQDHVGVLRTAEQSYHQCREDGVSLDILCPELFVLGSRIFLIGSELIQFYIQYPNKSIINYIHQSDGKKRIYSFRRNYPIG